MCLSVLRIGLTQRKSPGGFFFFNVLKTKTKKDKKYCFKKDGKKIQQTVVKVEERILGREMYSALLKRHSFGTALSLTPLLAQYSHLCYLTRGGQTSSPYQGSVRPLAVSWRVAPHPPPP